MRGLPRDVVCFYDPGLLGSGRKYKAIVRLRSERDHGRAWAWCALQRDPVSDLARSSAPPPRSKGRGGGATRADATL